MSRTQPDRCPKPQKRNPGRIPHGRGGSGVHEIRMADRKPDVKLFFYTDEILDQLELWLSSERLTTCLDAVGGDREHAIQLHDWNTAVNTAFYGPLQGSEVALSNAIIEKFEDYWDVRFAVVLLTSVDVCAPAKHASELILRARQNVAFELGYFIGRQADAGPHHREGRCGYSLGLRWGCLHRAGCT